MSIPRRLSHHVPVVPIINWDPAEMERRETAEYQVLHCTVCTVVHCIYSFLYQDTDSDQLQLYKSASVEQYELVAVDKVSGMVLLELQAIHRGLLSDCKNIADGSFPALELTH